MRKPPPSFTYFFGILHPFDRFVLVGTGNKGNGILFGIGAVHAELDDLLDGVTSSVGLAVTEKISCDAHSLSTKQRFLELFKSGCRSRGTTLEGDLDLVVGVVQKGLGGSSLLFQTDSIASVQEFDSDLFKRNVGNNLDHFLESDLGFCPASNRAPGFPINRVGL